MCVTVIALVLYAVAVDHVSEGGPEPQDQRTDGGPLREPSRPGTDHIATG